MSDLPPPEQSQPPRARRAARPKSRSAAARRANRASNRLTNDESVTESVPRQAEEPTLDDAIETAQQETTNPYEPARADLSPAEPTGTSLRGFPIFSRQMLLWAAIVGAASLALSIIPTLIVGLHFVGGWRATLRQGDWKQGGMTGFWSVIIATVLGLIISVIYAAAIQQLDKLNGDYFTGLLEGLIIQVLLSFSLGAMGGSLSVWQRRRAEQQQEALTSSS